VGKRQYFSRGRSQHDNPDEMHAVTRRRERRIEASRDRGAVTGPDDL